MRNCPIDFDIFRYCSIAFRYHGITNNFIVGISRVGKSIPMFSSLVHPHGYPVHKSTAWVDPLVFKSPWIVLPLIAKAGNPFTNPQLRVLKLRYVQVTVSVDQEFVKKATVNPNKVHLSTANHN